MCVLNPSHHYMELNTLIFSHAFVIILPVLLLWDILLFQDVLLLGLELLAPASQ